MSPLALVLALASATVQDIDVQATVNASRIGVQDVLELTVSISGGGGGAEPELPAIDGFRVTGRSTSSQFQIVNGQMSSTRSFIYQLLPQKEGTFSIGAVAVESGGKTYRTDPITVEVVSGSLAPRTSPGRGSLLDPFPRRRPVQISEEDVFVRAEASKPSVYLGEQLVVTYRLYSRFVPLGPEIEDDPALTGFWVEEVDLGQPSGERRTIEGKEFFTFPLKQRVLFPTKTGTLDVPPLTLSMAFRLSASDPFDAFFARASEPVTLRTQPVSIEVRPLPVAGRGREFEGAVGEYRFSAELNKEEVRAGDPVSLTFSIEGKGNLRVVKAPELPELAGFRT
ncbi:MAG TPA: BatD family protein, partial [Vicinamibacteria bacterium]|nr:BatD family protein [Vicinamibacteria bacterium]